MQEEPDAPLPTSDETQQPQPVAKKTTRKNKPKKRASRKRVSSSTPERKRTARPYPASSFQEALPLAEAVHEYASGEKVRLLTLLKQLDKSTTSSATRMLITNSAKYGLTTGGYMAEWLELTELGYIASSPVSSQREKLEASFKLSIDNIAPFQRLYSEYRESGYRHTMC